MRSVQAKRPDAPPESPVFSTGVTGEGYVYDGDRHTLSMGWSRRGFIETLGMAGLTLAAAPLASLLLPTSAVAGVSVQELRR